MLRGARLCSRWATNSVRLVRDKATHKFPTRDTKQIKNIFEINQTVVITSKYGVPSLNHNRNYNQTQDRRAF